MTRERTKGDRLEEKLLDEARADSRQPHQKHPETESRSWMKTSGAAISTALRSTRRQRFQVSEAFDELIGMVSPPGGVRKTTGNN